MVTLKESTRLVSSSIASLLHRCTHSVWGKCSREGPRKRKVGERVGPLFAFHFQFPHATQAPVSLSTAPTDDDDGDAVYDKAFANNNVHPICRPALTTITTLYSLTPKLTYIAYILHNMYVCTNITMHSLTI